MTETFRDDIGIDPARLQLWSIEPFDDWRLVNEGAFGKVFHVQVSPYLEIAGRSFRCIALKDPKRGRGVAELKSEVESLSKLSHPNVCTILGMVYGKTKGSGSSTNWTMCLEWCDLDLTRLLYEPEEADPQGIYQ